MDQLPDLQSDADVDALMARVRAKLVVPTPAGAPAAATSERSGNALRDFLAVQEEYASAMMHALDVIGAALEDFDQEKENTGRRRGRRIDRPASRSKGGQRKPR
jgi:hypothetical protein